MALSVFAAGGTDMQLLVKAVPGEVARLSGRLRTLRCIPVMRGPDLGPHRVRTCPFLVSVGFVGAVALVWP